MSVLNGVVIVIVLSVANAWGSYFQDDFNRPDGEVGNGWETIIGRIGYHNDLGNTEGNIEVKIVENEVLIAGQQSGDWWKSGISRFVDGATRFSFDFKADDHFNVIIMLYDEENPNYRISFYAAWTGGPFSYMWNYAVGNWTAWTQIPGSQIIAGQYNTLVIEQSDTEFILTLNGKVVGTVVNNHITHIGEVFISGDAAAGTVGSLHIDNVVIGQPPIITNFDFNGDGIIDSKDVCIMVEYWGSDYSLCDIAPPPFGDGVVDIEDLKVLAEHLFEEVPIALVGYWKMDETEGSIAYDSSGDQNATLYGNPVWQPADGKIDGALQFDGIDDYASAGFVLNPSSGPFSAYAWIKGDTPGQVIISQTDGTGFGGTWLGADQANGKLFTNLMYFELASESVITDEQWHHVGIVWDGSRRYLYVDEEEVAKDTSDMTAIQSTGDLYLGAGKNLEAGTFFYGLIDDIRIYKRAVSP